MLRLYFKKAEGVPIDCPYCGNTNATQNDTGTYCPDCSKK